LLDIDEEVVFVDVPAGKVSHTPELLRRFADVDDDYTVKFNEQDNRLSV